jgi:hypothetical protein
MSPLGHERSFCLIISASGTTREAAQRRNIPGGFFKRCPAQRIGRLVLRITLRPKQAALRAASTYDFFLRRGGFQTRPPTVALTYRCPFQRRRRPKVDQSFTVAKSAIIQREPDRRPTILTLMIPCRTALNSVDPAILSPLSDRPYQTPP